MKGCRGSEAKGSFALLNGSTTKQFGGAPYFSFSDRMTDIIGCDGCVSESGSVTIDSVIGSKSKFKSYSSLSIFKNSNGTLSFSVRFYFIDKTN